MSVTGGVTRNGGESQRSSVRLPVAATALVGAAAHVPVTGEHLHQAPYIGVLFIALEVALVVLAVLVLLTDSLLVWRAAALVPALAIAAYVVSRTVGLPQIQDDVGNWTEPLGVVSVAAEAVMVLLVLGRTLRPVQRVHGRLLPALLATALLVVGLVATTLASRAPAMAMAPGSSSHGMGAMEGESYWQQVSGEQAPATGTTRTYYISSDPVRWSYAPLGHNGITGKPFDDVAKTYLASGPGRVGSTYVKCLYRGYSDGSFTHRDVRPADERYLGDLGPVIHAEVGDTIKVVFRNTCDFPTSVHPHGVFYTKSSEGAPYADGTRGAKKADDAVPTGHRHVYVWKVPPRAGPGPGDGSSVMWMYHSHSDEIRDTYAGLMGPMVVTRAGMARADGSPKDVDREVFENFFIDNESLSPGLQESEDELGTPPFPAHPEDDEAFEEANLKHSINGYLFGNQPMLTLRTGERVRWYVMSMGTETDLHTPHWHGNDVTVGGMRMDVVSLLPASMVTADMVPDDVGTWLFHCHVGDHIAAGMMTRYRVVR
jgi:hypothetical protein